MHCHTARYGIGTGKHKVSCSPVTNRVQSSNGTYRYLGLERGDFLQDKAMLLNLPVR